MGQYRDNVELFVVCVMINVVIRDLGWSARITETILLLFIVSITSFDFILNDGSSV